MEARDLLAALQASAPHSLPPADIEQKTVKQDGLAVSLTIVRPINVRERGPAFLFLPWRWVRAGRLFDA